MDRSDSITPLGSILRARKLITARQLETAMAIQKETGDRLGRILLGQGYISAQTLHQIIAEHHNRPFIDLRKTPPDPSLLSQQCLDEYLALELIPFRQKDDMMFLAATDISFGILNWARKRYGENFHIVITSPFDIRWAIEEHFRPQLV